MKVKSLFLLLPLIMYFNQVTGQFISAPKLQCIINDVSNNNIDIHWSNTSNPCGPFVDYSIYRSGNINGPYTLIATIITQAQTTYTDPGIGGGTWFYYMEANFNCPGFTVLQSDTLENIPPAIPQLINVTVIGSTVQINWEPSTSPNTYYYIVYYAGYNSILIDTVFGLNNTTYIDINGFPSQQSVPYTIQAFDSCNQSINTNFAFHQTILLQSSQDLCEREVELDWSRYINWPSGVLEYRIYGTVNNGPEQLIAAVDSGTFDYTFSNYDDFDTLCFTIRAVSAADTLVVSNSNPMCFIASIVQPPDYIYLTHLTVNNLGQIEMSWIIDTMSELRDYQYEVSTDGGLFSRAGQATAPSPVNFVQSFTDSLRNPNLSAYYYQLNATDDCEDVYLSTLGRTIYLEGELTDFFENSLAWNKFEMEFATVSNYNIYRDFGSGYQFIASVPDNDAAYIDDVSDFLDQNGSFCYQIEAEYRLDLPNGFSKNGTSRSNIVCIDQRVLIYVPLVFMPSQPPGVFQPTVLFGNTDNYSMLIYNRWGGLVFQSNDINSGWDGMNDGEPVPTGGYVYIIDLNGVNGTPIREEGIVTLVR